MKLLYYYTRARRNMKGRCITVLPNKNHKFNESCMNNIIATYQNFITKHRILTSDIESKLSRHVVLIAELKFNAPCKVKMDQLNSRS